MADRVDNLRSDHARCAVDSCRIAEEGVQVLDTSQRRGAGVEDAKDAVGRLNREAVPDTQRLVRGLHRELLADVGKSLVAVVETLNAGLNTRVGCGQSAGGDDGCIQWLLWEYAFDAVARIATPVVAMTFRMKVLRSPFAPAWLLRAALVHARLGDAEEVSRSQERLMCTPGG